MKTNRIELTAKDVERFWQKVNVEGAHTCWTWTGFVRPNGYGAFHVARSGARFAHRISLVLALGRDIKSGLLALHSCGNRSCVNPAHLREGSSMENGLDSVRDGTNRNAAKAECPRGHPYTRSLPNSWRTCDKCGRESNKRWVERNRSELAMGKRISYHADIEASRAAKRASTARHRDATNARKRAAYAAAKKQVAS